MIKTVIVEDELKSRDMLAAMIRKITPELDIVGLAGNVSEAEKLILHSFYQVDSYTLLSHW